MKLIIPTKDNKVDSHFGHCESYTLVVLDDNNNVLSKEMIESPKTCGCKSNIVSTFVELGVDYMLAGNIGQGAVNKISQGGIKIIRSCTGEIDAVVESFIKGNLQDSDIVCDSHNCSH